MGTTDSAKEYMRRAAHTMQIIERLEERREVYEDMSARCTAQYQTEPHGTKRNGSRVEEYAVKIADITAEIQAELGIFADQVREIEAVIDAVPCQLYRDVLKLRYLNLWPWKRVAETLDFTREYIFHIHAQALQAVVIPQERP